MAKWSNNNRACLTTWTTLMVLDQSDESFSSSGDIKVSEFTFYSTLDSADIRQLQAKSVSRQMHNIFINVRRAELEKGNTKKAKNDAIAALAAVLSNGKKTMSDLADVADDHYKFLGEPSHED